MIRIRAGLLLFVLVLALALSARAGAAPESPGAVSAATGPLKDINPTPGESSYPMRFVSVGALTFFTADDGSHGFELWRTDGTAAGTALVRDFNPGPQNGVGWLLANNNRLFMAADDGIHGAELWVGDGTDAGMVMVTDILTGSAGSMYQTSSVAVALGDTVFFPADDGVHGIELWRSDGTAAGTSMVKDVNVGGDWGVGHLTAMGDIVFFTVKSTTEAQHPRRLWRTDGTAAGTFPVSDMGDPNDLVVVGDHLYFTAYSDNARVVASTDGTVAGTTIKDGLPMGPGGNSDATLISVAGLLYMEVASPTKYCGETRTPNWSLGHCANNNGYGPGDFTEAGGDVFFGYKGDDHGAEIWRSANGTGEPELAYDINPGAGDSRPRSFMKVNDRLYFVADDGAHGEEIWSRDPSTGQVNMVADIVPGPGSVAPWLVHSNGAMVFFEGTDAEHGRELWVVPGTIAPDGEYKAYLPLVQHQAPAGADR